MSQFRVLLVVVFAFAAVQLPAVAHPADPSLYRIPFASGTVDPAADWNPVAPSGRDLVLVQWSEFGARGIVEAIAGTGVSLVQPLAPVSYLVWADAEQTVALRSVAGVRFAGVLPAEVRVAPSVDAATTTLRVTVVGREDLGGLALDTMWKRAFTGVQGAVVEVPGGALEAQALAGQPRVYSVADAGGAPQLRDEMTAQVVAKGTKPAPPGPGYRDFLTRIGADGSGVILSHVDGGVDTNHPDLAGRIEKCIGYGADGPARCAAGNHDDAIGHGTHTLGIVLGTGSTPFEDLGGFNYGLGVAPGAKAIVQNAIHTGMVGDAWADGYRPVYRQAQELGAVLSQNSWGPGADPQGYDADTREFDSMVRDVNDKQPGDQPLGLVFSVMNGSGGKSTQGSPDEGKNLIGVGGTGARRLQSTEPGLDDLCTCSAHGPALDGRFLPTIVAPGQNVMSTRAAQGTLCGLSGTTGETPPSPLHAPCTGTSMASPHVSGAYAVFVDWYRDHHAGTTPSPALVKAALVNGAVDLAGAKDADGKVMTNIPNNQQGWGRLNLGNTVDGWLAGAVHVDQSVVFDASGERHTIAVEPIDPTKPMKASLAWTDALGHGLGGKLPAWVNDLNLRVAAPDGTTYLGNVFTKGASVAGGIADQRNNLENVYLTSPATGTHTVTVEATNLIGDALPNRSGLTDQDFALVITNARTVAP